MDKIKVIDKQIAAENKKIKKIEKDIENLEKEKQIHQMRKGDAYFCSSCKKFVSKSTANSDMIKYRLCYNCNTKRKKEEQKKIVSKDLMNAMIVDIKVTEWGQIEELYLKNPDKKIISVGTRYDEDDGDAWLRYQETCISEDRYPTTETNIVKPGMKPRTENPLSDFKSKGE